MKRFSSLTSYLCLLLLCWISTTTLAQTTGRDEIVFFFNDAQGSAVAAVNESGELCWREEYTPYGDKNINDDLIAETGCGIIGEERGFTGHTEDVNSDLVYMQQRYYDPGIGRFLSIDPLDANPNDPRTYNRYAYAHNNPYKFIDPDGRAAETPWDAANVGIGLLSAAANLTTGNYLSAAIDLGGAAIDAAATVTPFVPGGVSTLIQSNRAARVAAELVENVPNSADTVIGRIKDLQELKKGEQSLLNRLQDRGSFKANWKQNSSVLRQEMGKGKPIRDASPGDNSGQFLNAERNLLRDRGWTFDSKTNYWNPPD